MNKEEKIKLLIKNEINIEENIDKPIYLFSTSLMYKPQHWYGASNIKEAKTQIKDCFGYLPKKLRIWEV
jgi:hypothetical protein